MNTILYEGQSLPVRFALATGYSVTLPGKKKVSASTMIALQAALMDLTQDVPTKILLRVHPEVHRLAYEASKRDGVALNGWIEDACWMRLNPKAKPKAVIRVTRKTNGTFQGKLSLVLPSALVEKISKAILKVGGSRNQWIGDAMVLRLQNA